MPSARPWVEGRGASKAHWKTVERRPGETEHRAVVGLRQ